MTNERTNERTNEQPLVSVIVPIYNTKKYLENCLNSIINQTYSNIEVILIDDGSTDGSEKLCDEYVKVFSNCRVFHNCNQGIGMARNCGIEHAKGEFLMFVDSDDYLNKNIIELFVQNAISECADFVAAGVEQVSEAGNIKGKSIPVSTVKCSGIDALRLHYQDKAEGLLLAYVTGRLYKKSIFDEIRFMPNIFYEDVSIMPRILLNSKKLVYLPIIGYHYVIREQSVSHSEKNFLKLYKDSFEIWEDHIQLYKNHNLTEFERYISLLVCEKIVAHGEKKTIPKIYYEQSIKLLKGNLFMAMKANIPIKRKIRLLVYSIKQCVNKR